MSLANTRRKQAGGFQKGVSGTPRDAADLIAAVIAAVGAGRVTPGEGAEVSKMMDAFVKAYQAAELNDRSVPINQMTDEELMRFIRSSESTPPLLTINSD